MPTEDASWPGIPTTDIIQHMGRLSAKYRFTNFLAASGIKWKFIAELSSWQGGMYQRIVRLVKCAVRKSVARRHLSAEEIVTLLTEVESEFHTHLLMQILTVVLGDLLVVTPSHFLPPPKCGIGLPISMYAAQDRFYCG